MTISSTTEHGIKRVKTDHDGGFMVDGVTHQPSTVDEKTFFDTLPPDRNSRSSAYLDRRVCVSNSYHMADDSIKNDSYSPPTLPPSHFAHPHDSNRQFMSIESFQSIQDPYDNTFDPHHQADKEASDLFGPLDPDDLQENGIGDLDSSGPETRDFLYYGGAEEAYVSRDNHYPAAQGGDGPDGVDRDFGTRLDFCEEFSCGTSLLEDSKNLLGSNLSGQGYNPSSSFSSGENIEIKNNSGENGVHLINSTMRDRFMQYLAAPLAEPELYDEI